MPGEGMLGGYKIAGERVGTDEHPLVRKHLPIDTTVVTTVLEPGVLLKEVEVKGAGDQSASVIEHIYVPWAEADAESPCAVVDDRFDPESDASADCIVHGCVRTRVLKVGASSPTAPSVVALTKLSHHGIFAV